MMASSRSNPSSEHIAAQTARCRWLHEQLEALTPVCWPFALTDLPKDGIYAFYEDGQTWGHGGDKSRIVRIGTHRNGNFRSRIRDHFAIGKDGRPFGESEPSPKDRSIFRKNLGRVVLSQPADAYLEVWNLDLTSTLARETNAYRRNIRKEQDLEAEITQFLRNRFWFKFLILEPGSALMGNEGLEAPLIGTLAHCQNCKPTRSWLGSDSPMQPIRDSGLWLTQHLKSNGLTDAQAGLVGAAIPRTNQWMTEHGWDRTRPNQSYRAPAAQGS